jgi:hypothetical protein
MKQAAQQPPEIGLEDDAAAVLARAQGKKQGN